MRFCSISHFEHLSLLASGRQTGSDQSNVLALALLLGCPSSVHSLHRMQPSVRMFECARYSRGPIFSAASFELIAGYTSKSTMSLQFAIH